MSLGVLLALGLVSTPLRADRDPEDPFMPYREVIDDPEADPERIDAAIAGLERLDPQQVERDYLLGMLYLRRALLAIAHGSDPDAPGVRSSFERADELYAGVEKRQPGYRYIHCKRAELYLYSRNPAGLERVTRSLGEAEQNERTDECKTALMDIAPRLAEAGGAAASKRIYRAALSTWRPYPARLAEALGDLEDADGDAAEARRWWKVCADNAPQEDRARCRKKAEADGSGLSLDEFLESRADGCYVRHASARDHVLVGCPIAGYHPDEEVARQARVMVAMLPESLEGDGPPPALFIGQTYPLEGYSLIALFENDLQGVLSSQPGTRVVEKILEKTPARMGECAGAELEVPDELTPFPHQIYFFCKKYSKRYALMVSLLATSKANLGRHRADFLRWANVPQHVRDYDVENVDGSR